jgi:hypothetical protein
MKPRNTAIALLVVLVAVSANCGGARFPVPRASPAVKPLLVTGERYEGAIFSTLQGDFAMVPEGTHGYWTPAKSDVAAFEQGLRAFLESAIDDPTQADGRTRGHPQRGAYLSGEIRKIVDNLSRYRRQYYGVVVGGSRQLYVNFFPGPDQQGRDDHLYWLESFVFVNDGGSWYWTVRYDPVEKKYLGFQSNGYA